MRQGLTQLWPVSFCAQKIYQRVSTSQDTNITKTYLRIHNLSHYQISRTEKRKKKCTDVLPTQFYHYPISGCIFSLHPSKDTSFDFSFTTDFPCTWLNIMIFPLFLLHVTFFLSSRTYKVVQICPGRFVCKQVTVCPGHIWTTLYVSHLTIIIFNSQLSSMLPSTVTFL
jgi:hypothetical protein